jgi:hypothetical protein
MVSIAVEKKAKSLSGSAWGMHRDCPSGIAAWEHDRNANHTTANWQFTAPNARIKLKHLYPFNLTESAD